MRTQCPATRDRSFIFSAKELNTGEGKLLCDARSVVFKPGSYFLREGEAHVRTQCPVTRDRSFFELQSLPKESSGRPKTCSAGAPKSIPQPP